ncbi:MAG: cell division protein FtsQ/DivIB [Opitutaceae bacterium]
MIGSGRDKGGTSANGDQSWRELAGPNKKRINSPQARKRRLQKWFKFLGLLIFLAAIIGGLAWVVITLKNRDTAIEISTPSKPIERILFDTDGVLPDRWLSTVINLRPGMSLMDADIHKLKAELEIQGQVKSASVARVFPSDLKITIEERTPTLRMAVPGKNGSQELKLVARDGTVYKGAGYPTSMLKHLPFVQPYLSPEGKYLPMRGISRVAELLDYSRKNTPKLYGTWRVVSLEHYSGDLELPGQIIEIRSSWVPRIIFSAGVDYGQQLDRLNYILAYVQERGNPSIERIDLSLRGSAAVQFSSGRIGTF